MNLFREENIPLQTEDAKLGQQYDEINGVMMVEFQKNDYAADGPVRAGDRSDHP